jgi:hypothetical protein
LRGSHNLNPETNDDNNAMSITSNQTLSTITASSQASQRALQKGAAKVVVTKNKGKKGIRKVKKHLMNQLIDAFCPRIVLKTLETNGENMNWVAGRQATFTFDVLTSELMDIFYQRIRGSTFFNFALTNLFNQVNGDNVELSEADIADQYVKICMNKVVCVTNNIFNPCLKLLILPIHIAKLVRKSNNTFERQAFRPSVV